MENKNNNNINNNNNNNNNNNDDNNNNNNKGNNNINNNNEIQSFPSNSRPEGYSKKHTAKILQNLQRNTSAELSF